MRRSRNLLLDGRRSPRLNWSQLPMCRNFSIDASEPVSLRAQTSIPKGRSGSTSAILNVKSLGRLEGPSCKRVLLCLVVVRCGMPERLFSLILASMAILKKFGVSQSFLLCRSTSTVLYFSSSMCSANLLRSYFD